MEEDNDNHHSDGGPLGAPVPLTGRREHPRLRLNLPARIDLIDGPAKCSLENVSAKGARVAMVDCPPVHALGLLRCSGLDTCFTVIWRVGCRVGLLFDRPISQETVIGLRRTIDNTRRLEFEDLRREAMDWVGVAAHQR
jgi:hypothetical protein